MYGKKAKTTLQADENTNIPIYLDMDYSDEQTLNHKFKANDKVTIEGKLKETNNLDTSMQLEDCRIVDNI